MATPNRLAVPFRFLIVSALVVTPGCGGTENPARYTGSIDMPSREPSRVDAKVFAREKALNKANRY